MIVGDVVDVAVVVAGDVEIKHTQSTYEGQQDVKLLSYDDRNGSKTL